MRIRIKKAKPPLSPANRLDPCTPIGQIAKALDELWHDDKDDRLELRAPEDITAAQYRARLLVALRYWGKHQRGSWRVASKTDSHAGEVYLFWVRDKRR